MKFIKFWFPVLLYSAIIFYVSHLPNLAVPGRWPFSDKIIHVFEYALLGFLFTRALNAGNSDARGRRAIIIGLSFLFCFLYGISDEIHQLYVPGREASLGDLIADGMGGVLGGMYFLK